MPGRGIGAFCVVGVVGLLSGLGVAFGQSPTVTLSLAPSSDTGASSEDGITRDSTPTVQGTAPANAKIEVRDGSQKVAQVTASSSGAWNITSATLSDGPHSLVAYMIAPTPSQSAPIAILVDTVKPGTPTITVAGPTKTASDGSLITNDATPTLTGEAEAGVTVTVWAGSAEIGSAVADGGGVWQVTSPPLGAQKHRFKARAEDPAGNKSASSPSIGVIITGAPIDTLTISLDPSSDTGASTNDRVTRDNTPTLLGTAAPRTRVEVREGSRVLGSAIVASSGSWKLTTKTLSDGVHGLVVAASANGATSAVLEVTVDREKPTAPTLLLAGWSPTGAPKLKGKTSPGAIVTVLEGETLLGTEIASGSGKWTLTATVLAEGEHALIARAVDPAGNESGTSKKLKVEVEAHSTVTLDLAAESDTSRSDDNITRDRTPTLQGTASQHSQVTVTDRGTTLGTVVADGSGQWSYTASQLDVGEHRFRASAGERASSVLSVQIAASHQVIDLNQPAAGRFTRIEGIANFRDGEAEHPHSAVGDVNGDGLPDFVVGEPEGDRDSHLIFGRGAKLPSSIDVRTLGANGVRLVLPDVQIPGFGPGQQFSELGPNSAGIGDVNGDGWDDLAVQERNGGRVYVVFGRANFPLEIDLSALDGTNGGFILQGPTTESTFGNETYFLPSPVFSVARAGDFNADEFADFIIGVPEVPLPAGATAMATIIYGRPTFSNMDFGVLGAQDQLSYVGAAQDWSGISVAGGGDINGDGIGDVIVGLFDASSGGAVVLYGSRDTLPNVIYHQELNGENGAAFGMPAGYACDFCGDSFGSVSMLGDVDGDGFDDFVSAANFHAMVVYGGREGFGDGLRPNQWLQIYFEGNYNVRNVSGAGDVDGDGLADILFQNQSWPFPDDETFVSATGLLFGRDLRRTGVVDVQDAVNGTAGTLLTHAHGHVSAAGDVDGDGKGDFLTACETKLAPSQAPLPGLSAACLVYGF